MAAPSQVTAGQTFTVPLNFKHPKTGWVAVYGAGYGGPGGASFFSANPADPRWAHYRAESVTGLANFNNVLNGSVSVLAPGSPGDFQLAVIVPADGGTLSVTGLQVVQPQPSACNPSQQAIAAFAQASPSDQAIYRQYNPGPGCAEAKYWLDVGAAQAAAAAAASATATPTPPAVTATSPSASAINPFAPPGAPIYTPPNPEPAASDGAKLSMQGADVQAYYVANAGPGMLAATAFVVDHEHQLAAIGSARIPSSSSTYTPPPNELAASDGEKLSMQSPDVQAYYVSKYGPGFLAAVGFVNERNASLGTSIPGGAPTVLPAGPGAGGADTGLFTGGMGAGDWSNITTATPQIPGAAAGNPPPTFSNLVSEVTSNKPLLIGLAVGVYFLLGGEIPSVGHRRR